MKLIELTISIFMLNTEPILAPVNMPKVFGLFECMVGIVGTLSWIHT